MGTSAEPVSRRIEQEAVSEAGERSSIIKADKKAGKLVGPYLVGELIGEGTQGKVKEAVHSETLRRVAIKIVNKLQLRKIKNAEENMKRELKIHRRLKHEHVVELLEVLEVRKPDKEKQYIVLELINGGSLQDILDELPTHVLPVRLAARIGRQLFRGLEYIHSKGVVHRDIKPSNLMVTSDGVLKITDLGVAELLDECAPPAARPPAARPPPPPPPPPPPRRRRRRRAPPPPAPASLAIVPQVRAGRHVLEVARQPRLPAAGGGVGLAAVFRVQGGRLGEWRRSSSPRRAACPSRGRAHPAVREHLEGRFRDADGRVQPELRLAHLLRLFARPPQGRPGRAVRISDGASSTAPRPRRLTHTSRTPLLLPLQTLGRRRAAAPVALGRRRRRRLRRRR